MNNIDVFNSFWNDYEILFRDIWNRNSDDEILEKLIYDSKDIFIKNTIQITGVEFTLVEVEEINEIVEEFFKS
ncbi:hypothetical protein [Flavobacterium sp.]|jgi:hypothetical protein|uniref:hypothetical protein n=1 Tax=Flavobacterium sp. TaxID=239 RepID=UPI0037BF9042